MFSWFFWQTITFLTAVIASSLVVFTGMCFRALLRTKTEDSEVPVLDAGLGFLVFFSILLLMPSYPRYQFEKVTDEMLSQSPWVKLVESSKSGSIFEPLTWFKTPVSYYRTLQPNIPSIGGFTETILQYGDEPKHFILEPECETREVAVSYEKGGQFVYATKPDGSFDFSDMDDDEYKLLCQYDWANEKEELRSKILENL